MTRGRELPVSSRVRRRLFSEDEETPSTPDGNVLNNLQNERIAKGMKWNFDFTSEKALVGPIEWFKKSNSDEWVGMQPTSPINIIQDMINEVEYKAVSEDERSEDRELPRHMVLQRQALADRQALEDAMEEGRDDNDMNQMEEESAAFRKDMKEASGFLKEYSKVLSKAYRVLKSSIKHYTHINKYLKKENAAMDLQHDGHESDDDQKDDKKFKALKISDNTDNQCSKEEQTDIKDINETTPTSIDNLNGLRHKRKRLATAPRKEMNKKRRLLL